MTDAPLFNAWLDDFMTSYFRHRPVNATFVGEHRYDDRLPDCSPAGLRALEADTEELLARLHALPSESLSEAEALDRQLAEGFLDIQRWELRSRHFVRGNPAWYTGEATFGVIGLFLRSFAPIEQRAASAIARLNAVPTLLAQGTANLQSAPASWTERARRECGGALAFLGGGIEWLIAEHGLDGAELRAAADRAANAFRDFDGFLAELPVASDDVAACGAEAFDLLLRRGHFLDEDAAGIEAHAQAELDAAAAYLEAHAADFGAASWPEALAQLAPIHPTAEAYYGRYAELWEKCRATAIERDLLTWPDFPIRYVPQPAWAREAAPSLYFLFYRSPAPLDQAPVTEYLVTPVESDMPPERQAALLRATNDSVIKLNHVVHHGAIGHHVQNWHAMRSPSRIGRIAAADCASRIALFCGGTMAEGWACYATELMDEVGFLTPLEHYAERHARLRMAARALVDIRLHDGRYSLDDAAAFYRDQVGMSPAAARGEAVKNSMFPATATMYLVGTDLIHRLRRDLAELHGARFDLRQFHDRLLAWGSVPVALIGARMRQAAAAEPAQGGAIAAHRS